MQYDQTQSHLYRLPFCELGKDGYRAAIAIRRWGLHVDDNGSGGYRCQKFGALEKRTGEVQLLARRAVYHPKAG
jgi:hypothetical protein